MPLPPINDVVWKAMMERLGGATCGLVHVVPCPVCGRGRLQGYANREGHVLARCTEPECFGAGSRYGMLALRP